MYCKNCGSILQNNANFCHVCGTKVDYEDVFQKPEEEKKETPDDFTGFGYEESKRSYYDTYAASEKSTPNIENKKPFVASMVGFIGGLFLLLNSLLTYYANWSQYSEAYEKGVIAQYSVYISSMKKVMGTCIFYFILSAGLSITLGVVGTLFSKKEENKKGFVLGILSCIIGVISFALMIVFIVFYAKAGK